MSDREKRVHSEKARPHVCKKPRRGQIREGITKKYSSRTGEPRLKKEAFLRGRKKKKN